MPTQNQTRFLELGYEKHDTHLWRIICTEDGAAVGPHYQTKFELLSDLERYAKEYGATER